MKYISAAFFLFVTNLVYSQPIHYGHYSGKINGDPAEAEIHFFDNVVTGVLYFVKDPATYRLEAGEPEEMTGKSTLLAFELATNDDEPDAFIVIDSASPGYLSGLWKYPNEDSYRIEFRETYKEDNLKIKLDRVSEFFSPEQGSGDDASVEIVFPKVEGKTDAIKKINDKITEKILDGFDTANMKKKFSGFHQIAEEFIFQYEKIVKSFADSGNIYSVTWYLDIFVTIEYNKGGLLGLRVVNTQYTGGDHGNYAEKLLNFDVKSGDLISLYDIIPVDKQSNINSLAEAMFIDKQGLINVDEISERYWFPRDTFRLNSNFIIYPDGLYFVYNPFEIAPWSEGMIDLFIKEENLLEFISPDWKKRK